MRGSEGPGGVVRHDGAVPLQAEVRFEHVGDVPLVVDDEDERCVVAPVCGSVVHVASDPMRNPSMVAGGGQESLNSRRTGPAGACRRRLAGPVARGAGRAA